MYDGYARFPSFGTQRRNVPQTSCSWELLDPISREKTAAVVRENAASLRKSLLSVVSMDLAGDMGDASLGAERRVEDVAKRCQMRGVRGERGGSVCSRKQNYP